MNQVIYKVKEVSEANMRKGIFHIYDPPRFMTVNQALEQLEEALTEEEVSSFEWIGLARVGSDP